MTKSLLQNDNAIKYIHREYEYQNFLKKFEESSHRDLDKHLNRELAPLLNTLPKTNEKGKEVIAFAIGFILGIYIANKIEKSLNDNLEKSLKV